MFGITCRRLDLVFATWQILGFDAISYCFWTNSLKTGCQDLDTFILATNSCFGQHHTLGGFIFGPILFLEQPDCHSSYSDNSNNFQKTWKRFHHHWPWLGEVICNRDGPRNIYFFRSTLRGSARINQFCRPFLFSTCNKRLFGALNLGCQQVYRIACDLLGWHFSLGLEQWFSDFPLVTKSAHIFGFWFIYHSTMI